MIKKITAAAPEAPTTDKYGREIIEHSLPEGLDFGGEEIVFIARDDPEFTIDFAVEEELNVTLKTFTVENTNTTNSESVGDHLRTAVMAGDNEYDPRSNQRRARNRARQEERLGRPRNQLLERAPRRISAA